MPGMGEVTRLLADAGRGNRAAAAELMPLIYDELRRLAGARMAQEAPGHTLQATALVHEAYLRLVGDEDLVWDSRGHFFTAAAEAIRRILIEHARKRNRLKRGGGRQRCPISVADLAAEYDLEEILAVDEAVRRLEQEDSQAADVVRLRFYAGLSVEETARALNLSPRSAAREWAYARAWLFRALQPDQP